MKNTNYKTIKNIMIRITQFLIIFSLVFQNISSIQTAYAGTDEAEFTLATYSGVTDYHLNDIVNFKMSISPPTTYPSYVPGISSFGFTITYNADDFEYSAAQIGAYLNNSGTIEAQTGTVPGLITDDFTIDSSTLGKLKVEYAKSDSGINSNGIFLSFQLRVKSLPENRASKITYTETPLEYGAKYVMDSTDPYPRALATIKYPYTGLSLNLLSTSDADSDGIADNMDNDDDNDGALDTIDAFPLNAAEWIDTDGDNIGNFSDTDWKGDGTPADTVKPTVTKFTPFMGSLSSGSRMEVLFSEDIIDKNFSKIQLKNNKRGNIYTTNLTSTIDGNKLTVKFSSGGTFEINTSYTLTVFTNAVADLYGNTTANDYNATFTTPSDVDRTAPYVSTSNPANNATGFDVSSNIVLTFNETILENNLSLLTLSDGTNNIPYTYAISDKVLTINPNDDLSYSKTYTLTAGAGAVKDVSYLLSTAKTITFTTQVDSAIIALVEAAEALSDGDLSTKALIDVAQAKINEANTAVQTLPNGTDKTSLLNRLSAAQLKITAAASVVSAITIKTAPSKVTYYAGDALDLSGLVVTITKLDESTENVAFSDFASKSITTAKENGDTLTTEDTQIVITVNGHTANQSITVNPAYVTEIIIKTQPDKTTYYNGDVLDLSGMVVTLTKSDSTTEDVVFADFASKGITTSIANGAALTISDVQVAVTANGHNAYQAIVVTSIAVTNIEIKTPPSKTSYYEGYHLDLSGLVVTLTKNNGTTEDVAYDGFASKGITTSIANGTILAPSDSQIIISVNGKSVTQNISVTALQVTGISIKTAPTKTTYFEGDLLNLSGLVVILTKNDGTTEDVALNDFESKEITTIKSNEATLTTADTQVAITANGHTVYQYITVNEVLNDTDNIRIKQAPHKIIYYEGESLDLSGMEVTINNTYSVLEDITFIDFESKGIYTNPTNGTILTTNNGNIAVTYNDYTVYQDITVYPVKITAISIKTSPTKTTYNSGERLDLSGLTTELALSNGSVLVIGLSAFQTYGVTTNPSNGAILSESNNTVKVMVDNKFAVLNISVNSSSTRGSSGGGAGSGGGADSAGGAVDVSPSSPTVSDEDISEALKSDSPSVNWVYGKMSITVDTVKKVKNSDKILELNIQDITIEYQKKGKMADVIDKYKDTDIFNLFVGLKNQTTSEEQNGIGVNKFDINASVEVNGTGSQEIIHSVQDPFHVTYNLSKYIKEGVDYNHLTAVRYNELGEKTYLGGFYNADDKTFSFYSDALGTFDIVTEPNVVDVRLTLNKKEIHVEQETKEIDVAPIVLDERTFVPIRFVAESLGAEVNWKEKDGTVEVLMNDKVITLSVDAKNSDYKTLIINDRLFVPIRYVVESLNGKVMWIQDKQLIVIVK